MKAVIMAAGVGSRLSRRVKHLPKCLLSFGGETILSRCIRALREHGVDDIVVVAGYRSMLVKEETDGVATCVINPFFRVTNSLASLWFAAKAVDLNDDLLLLNGDVIYEPGVLEAVLAAPKALTMLIDTSIIQRGDYRLKVEDDYIVDQGKQLPNEETSGEYVGIARLNKEFVPLYLARVRDLVEREEKYNMWWEEALFAIRDDFGMKIHVVDVNGLFWAEADFIEDVERIEAWFEAREHRSNVTAEELADVATRAAAASAGGDADGVLAAGLGQPRPDRTT